MRRGPATIRAFVLAFAFAFGARSANADPALLVRGQLLSTTGGYVVFTNGYAVRARAGIAVPKGVTIGSYVRAFVDRGCRCAVALELEPRTNETGEIDVADLPRAYVALSPRSVPSAPPPAPAGLTIGAIAGGLLTITIDVRVPANTPTSDDVYLATDRSNFSPAEIRMQRVDARDFTVSISLAGNTKLRYTFTRGSNATIERDRTGGIAVPHALTTVPSLTTHDAVIRWADIA